MAKIAIIGAGSLVFGKTLVSDILATSALQDSEICLLSRTRPKLEQMAHFVRRVIAENRLPAKVSATLDRRRALAGARFVIVTIQVGGMEAFRRDCEIPQRFGVSQCIGDTLGPGGIFRGLRTAPILTDIAREMEELCPGALLVNYANPLAINCLAVGRASKTPFVGLCHGVQTTLDLIGRYAGCPKERIDFLCAGINHLAWFLKLRDRQTGRDLYPRFKANCEKPEYYVNEKVRIEVMRHFGYFMTESSPHLSEYLPWFRSHRRALRAFCDRPDAAAGADYRFSQAITAKFAGVDYLAAESPKLGPRSVEYCSYVLEALATGRPFRFNGNVLNDGYITNLPRDCCVEVPVRADGRGLHPQRVGDLPPPLAALDQANVTVQRLAAQAALEGDPELVLQALALDPLTSAVCTLAEAREMARAMLEAERPWLPRFAGRKLARRPAIAVPRGTKGVEVPLDPALAIANRFVELAAAAGTPKKAVRPRA